MTKSKSAFLFSSRKLAKDRLFMWTFTFKELLGVKDTRKRWNRLLTAMKRTWPDDARLTQVSLGCTNRQVAEKKLRELMDEKEREAAGLIAPKAEREAANKPLKIHLEDWIAL